MCRAAAPHWLRNSARRRPWDGRPTTTRRTRSCVPPTARPTPRMARAGRAADGSVGAVEYLAVAQMPRGGRGSSRERSADGDTPPEGVARRACLRSQSPAALCGFRYTREPRRTWKQTMIPRTLSQVPATGGRIGIPSEGSGHQPAWAVHDAGSRSLRRVECTRRRGARGAQGRRRSRRPGSRARDLSQATERPTRSATPGCLFDESTSFAFSAKIGAMFRHSAHVYDLLYEGAGKDYAAEAAVLHSFSPGADAGCDDPAGRGVWDRRPSRPSAGVVRGGGRGPRPGHAGRSTTPSSLPGRGRRRHAGLRSDRRLRCGVVSVQLHRLHADRQDLDRPLWRPWSSHLGPGGVFVMDGWVRPDAWDDEGRSTASRRRTAT